MKVLDLTTLYLEGSESGVNTYLHEKARHLGERPDVEHVLIVPGRRTERRRLGRSIVHTIGSPRCPGKPDHRILTDFRRVRAILLAERPSIVETDCVYFLGRVARRALGRRVPLVGFYHVHLPTFIARPGVDRLVRSRPAADAIEGGAWRYVRFCCQPLDRIVVSSLDIRQRLAAAGFDRLDHVPLGVDRELFRPRDDVGRNGTKVILHVGRLSPEKNQADLIDAFRILAPRGDYRLRFVGDGPARPDLERRAAGDDRIEFLGTIPYDVELARLYAGADLLAQPSPNETFSLTVLEAIAAGLPVVAVDQGGPVDLVTPEVGELARPNDPSDLARRIERVVARAASRPAPTAPSTWQTTFDRLMAVYAGVLEQASDRPAEPARPGRRRPSPAPEALVGGAPGP